MCYDSRKFDREFEICGGPPGPVIDRNDVGDVIKRRVYFHIIKDMRIILQPTGIIDIGRIERTLP
jgi:hypothetical protein